MARRFRVALIAATMLASPVHAQSERAVLPAPTPPFTGTMAENMLDAQGTSQPAPQAPAGAPNVLLIMSDDVGFAMSSTFGGPVPTPNYDRLARTGQRYNRFHTTGICSPSRAALLTGHNHHNAGTGYLADMVAPFPGYGGRILPETATIAQVLRLNGYSTAMFGKDHNVPAADRSEAGPFDSWPTGRGFDYFYGFIGGDTDQFTPILYRGIQRAEPVPGDGRLLDRRLTDDIIRWVHNQKAGAPGKPFMVYFAPGSTHAPHQAPPEYIARFKGRFDGGWDRMREETWRRQLAMGIIPKGTRLTPRPAEIPAWDSLTSGQKAFAARTMEVAAAQLVYQDEQVGRLLDELQRMGQLDNTLVAAILGDNGASAEAGPEGTINELRSLFSRDEREAWREANIDRLGGPMTYESYPAGWSLAMNTPLRWTKQYASFLGGIRNGMILSWPGHVAHPGAVCSQFGHLIDMAPTVLEASHLPAPDVVLGAKQKPLDGQSLLASLTTACDPAHPRTQYFEIGGKIGLYHDGWFLSGEDGRMAWQSLPPGGARPQVSWSLYNLATDFSQATDLAAREPQKLKEMQALWQHEATRNNVFPLDHRFATARSSMGAARGPQHYDFWGKDVSVPAISGPALVGRSFTVTADLVLNSATASGVVLAYGSRFGGWSLFLDRGRPSVVWARSTDPEEIHSLTVNGALSAGTSRLTMRFAVDRPGGPATVALSDGKTELGRLALPSSVLVPAGTIETLDIGRDLGVPVTSYATANGAIEGDIPHLTIDFD